MMTLRRAAVFMALGVMASLLAASPSDAVALNAAGYQWADFDGDGEGDAAIGAPDEDVGSRRAAGVVHVFYGSTTSGLRGGESEIWHQSRNGVGGTPETGDRFGASFAVGDFDDDGFDDLAIGAPGEGLGNAERAGIVYVLEGSDDGLVPGFIIRQGALGVEGSAEDNDNFGYSLAGGDFDANGVSDLAVGIPGENLGSVVDAGLVTILFGRAPSGLSGAGAESISQNTTGVPGGNERGDRFGFSLCTLDFDGTGDDDLAVGAPYEGIGDRPEEGAVWVLLGGPTGLDPVHAHLMTQDTIFRQREGHSREHFGWSIGSGDMDPETTDPAFYDDLAIGVPDDLPGKSGAVNVVYGSEEGFVQRAEKWWQGKSDGNHAIAGTKEEGDRFGFSLAVNNFEPVAVDTRGADVAIGSPGENLGNSPDAGGVTVIYSNGAGLAAGGDSPNQFWSQNISGVGGDQETGDGFGTTLATGDYDNNGLADLLIGVPKENFAGKVDAGIAHVLYGDAVDEWLTSEDSETLSQDTNGVGGTAESGDRFGGALG